MSCNDDMKTLLSRYVDGELAKDERAKVDDHLVGCEPCRELLSIFQKNENLVASALSTEEFGNAVVEQVMSTIKKDSLPVARPIEESFGDWLRARPFLQLAAAALLAVGLVFVLNGSHASRTEDLRGEMKKQSALIDSLRQEQVKRTALFDEHRGQSQALVEEVAKLRNELAVKNALEHAPSGTVFGYVEREHYLVVESKFAPKGFTGYNVYRRQEKEKDFIKLNGDPLDRPRFTDRKAKPGYGYLYKFEALLPNDDPVESAPILIRVPSPGDFGPEQTIRIQCEKLNKPKDLAVFQLVRTVNGKEVRARFYTHLNQRIGGVEKIDGVGEVDFTTDLVLSRIGEGTQTLTVNASSPVLDPEGRTVVERLEGNTVVPRIRHFELSLGTRENMYAVLKPVGTNDAKSEEALWRDSWMVTRAR